MICPECGSIDFHEGRMCRKRKEVVCMDCCRLCEHSKKDEVYIRHICTYGQVSLNEKQLNKLKAEIEKLTAEQDDLYRCGRFRKADNLAWEIAGLKRNMEKLKNGQ